MALNYSGPGKDNSIFWNGMLTLSLQSHNLAFQTFILHILQSLKMNFERLTDMQVKKVLKQKLSFGAIL